MKLTPVELEALDNMMELIEQDMSNAGCNDFDVKNKAFAKAVLVHNEYEQEEIDETLHTLEREETCILTDYHVLRYLIAKLTDRLRS